MSNKKPKNVAAIIFLVIFFPVGLYLMWARTNWNKTIKIIITVLIAILVIIGIVSPNDNNATDKTTTTNNITSSITEFDMRHNEIVELELNGYVDSKNSYFIVKSDDEIDIDKIKFISENPDIATFTYDKTSAGNFVYYDIKTVSVGETYLYVQTEDESVTSNKIKVIVTQFETTTEATTQETTRDNSRTVYVTPTGEKYHFSKSCAGENARERTLNEVKGSYEPCKKCA